MAEPSDEEDPWGFLPKTRPEPVEGGTRGRRLAGGPVGDPLADLLGSPEPGTTKPAPLLPDPFGPPSPGRAEPAGGDAAASEQTKTGQPPGAQTPPAAEALEPLGIPLPIRAAADPDEIEDLTAAMRGEPALPQPGAEHAMGHPSAALRARARPLAIALAATSLAGLLTEVVGNSQLMTLVGPNAMLVMYPLSGLCLLAVALLQFRDIDARARVRMLQVVNLSFAVLLALALVMVVSGVFRAAAIGVIWLSADQLSFLIPLLIWAAASDEFNVAEGRRVFGWIIAWTYVGQLMGLAIGTFSPAIMDPLGVPLYWLLIADPIICGFLGLWLPRALSGAATASGQTSRESLRSALGSAWDFVWQIPAWRSLLGASILSFVAGMSLHLTYTMGVGFVVGDDAARLQVVFASMNLLALLVCWVISRSATERIMERLGIPGTLIIMPVATVVAGLLLAWGAAAASVALMIAGITVWRIPRLSVDESARRAALTLVPDQRRARVSFLVTLGPLGLGLMASGLVAGIGVLTGQFWVASVIAAVLALAGLPYALATRKRWDDSLLNWRMRRRKVMRHM